MGGSNLRRAARKLCTDRRGNFAVFTALTLLPVLMSIGAAVDMGLFYRDRTAVQSAVDAAALAAAKQFPFESDPKRLEDYARDFFEANTTSLIRMEASMTYEGTAWTSQRTRELRISACYSYDPIFLSLMKVNFDGLAGQNCAKAESVIVVGNTTVEVAMVLDTSGSMNDAPAKGGSAKIVTLRSEAQKAIETLFGSGVKVGDEDPVRIAVVPFSGGVNIGKRFLDEPWMDNKGLSSIHHENFDWKTYKGTLKGVPNSSLAIPAPLYPTRAWVSAADPTVYLTRQAIYKSVEKVNAKFAYRGCVEARPTPYGVTDTPPSDANPNSLFVPYFAPDEYDDYAVTYRVNSFLRDSGGDSLGERMRSMSKYFVGPKTDPDRNFRVGDNQQFTPSYMCDSDEVLPLTIDKAKALSSVKNLVATGSTNVAQGVEWGWHALSRNMPFPEGRVVGDDKNVKAMIVMTDGEHTYYNDTYNTGNPNISSFGAYGFSATNRIFDYRSGTSTAKTTANYTAAMDGRMAAICENAKNDGRIRLETARGVQLSDERGPVTRDGIVVYTIAFDIPASSKTRVDALLKGCASYKLDELKDTAKPYARKDKYFYSADNAAGLQAAFTDIMASLSSLRIAR